MYKSLLSLSLLYIFSASIDGVKIPTKVVNTGRLCFRCGFDKEKLCVNILITNFRKIDLGNAFDTLKKSFVCPYVAPEYWVPQKLPQILYTVIAYICIGKFAGFAV